MSALREGGPSTLTPKRDAQFGSCTDLMCVRREQFWVCETAHGLRLALLRGLEGAKKGNPLIFNAGVLKVGLPATFSECERFSCGLPALSAAERGTTHSTIRVACALPGSHHKLLYAVNMNTPNCTVARSLDRAAAPATFGHAGGMKAISRRLSAATPLVPQGADWTTQQRIRHRLRYRCGTLTTRTSRTKRAASLKNPQFRDCPATIYH